MANLIKSIRSFLTVVLISPEFLLILVAIAIGNLFGTKLVTIIPENALRTEVVKWAALLPVGPLAFSIKNWRELLAPDHKAAEILADWPERDLLFMTFKVGITYQVLFAIVALLFWVFDNQIRTRYGIPLFTISILASIVSVASHYFGWIKLRLLLDTFKTSH